MTSAFRAALALLTLAIFAVLTGGSAVAHGQGSPPGVPTGKPAVDFWLTVLHNNDGESKLLEQQFAIPGTSPAVLETHAGVARFKTLVDRLKAEATTGPPKHPGAKRGVVMLSSGDNFLAGPQFTASLEKGTPFYDSIAMNLVGYDAAAIGNHEFDFGPDVLADYIGGTTGFPWLSANLDFALEPRLQALVGSGRIARSTIVLERGERIGVVGATTPLLPAISSPRRVVVDPNVAAAVQREIDALEARGVNKIILSSHLQDVNADRALIPMLSGVDVAISGGGDELLANAGDPVIPGDVVAGPYPIPVTNADGRSVPVITTAGDFKYVGRLVVAFDRGGNVLRWDEDSGPVRVSGTGADAISPDPVVQARVVEPVAAFVADLAANVIGQSEVALEGRRGTPPATGTIGPGTAGGRRTETNLGNLLADSLRWKATQLAPSFGVPVPDVAIQNGGGIRLERLQPAGPITELLTFEIASFANFLSVVPNIPSAQFKELLENGVSRLPSADGRFVHISGASYTYDINGTPQVVTNAGIVTTPGTRIKDVRLDTGEWVVMNGIPVPGVSVDVGTHDFSARGGDQWPFRGAPFTTLGVTYQQGLAEYIESAAGLNGLVSSARYPESNAGGRIACIDATPGVAPECPPD